MEENICQGSVACRDTENLVNWEISSPDRPIPVDVLVLVSLFPLLPCESIPVGLFQSLGITKKPITVLLSEVTDFSHCYTGGRPQS